MSFKKRNRQKGRGGGKFVMLPEWIMKTTAWRSLSPNARCVFIELLRRYKGPLTNNGDLYLSAREAGDLLGVSKDTAARAMRELVDRGFVIVTQEDGFEWRDGKRQRRAARYALTHEQVGSAAATKEFLKWQAPLPEGSNVVPIRKAING